MTEDEQRVAVARNALARYEEWLHDEDPGRPLEPYVLGDLVSAARWLVEILAPEAVRPAGERCGR
jgi:hypothetical protein